MLVWIRNQISRLNKRPAAEASAVRFRTSRRQPWVKQRWGLQTGQQVWSQETWRDWTRLDQLFSGGGAAPMAGPQKSTVSEVDGKKVGRPSTRVQLDL
jgi:hypothetical protein